MEIPLMYISWIVPVIIIGAIYGYSLLVKRPLGMTGKYAESRLYKMPKVELLQFARYALEQADFNKIRVDEVQAIVSAKASVSFLSWGESIKVILQTEPDGTTIKFMSVCSLPAQVVDWGKNKSNAEKFFRELDKQILVNSNLRAA